MAQSTTLLNPMKEAFPFAWWLEIFTRNPNCIYYFGPFDSSNEAEMSQLGYIEDLTEEGAEVLTVKIKWYQPTRLDISNVII
jgi:hypothetical protein